MNINENPMISELFTEQDLLTFDCEVRTFLDNSSDVQYVVEPKITGVEVLMIYERGAFKSASTQKAGVTASVKTILTVPMTFTPLRKELLAPRFLEVRTDVYMEGEAFVQLNRERTAKNWPSFAGPRDAVEDSLLQTDPRVSSKRPLNYFCSGTGKNTELQSPTYYELMVALQELGLRVNRPHIKVAHGIQEAAGHCERLRGERGNFPYPVEGARIRVNALDLQARLARAPGRGMAVFRFSLQGMTKESGQLA